MELSTICAINQLGYGLASVHIVDELMKLGHKVNLFPIGQLECHPRHIKNIKLALQNSDTFSIRSPCIRIWHQHDMSMFVGKGCHIGFPIFELDTFTDKEKHYLRSCDCLYVCSEWAKQIVNNNINPSKMTLKYQHPTMVKVVPLGVDSDIFYPMLSSRKPTIFLNIGKWEVRKGHDVLVDIFEKAFSENDNVELWMMCDNPFLGEGEVNKWINKYKNSKLSNKIKFIPRRESDLEVADIMRQADCGVFPSRAEGWNLEALEMLACGKRLIISDYSAHTEYCTQENSHLVPIKELESAYDGKWFFNQGNWGKIDKDFIDCFAKYMRCVHEDKKNRNLTINTKGVSTAQNLSWKNTAETIVEHLNYFGE